MLRQVPAGAGGGWRVQGGVQGMDAPADRAPGARPAAALRTSGPCARMLWKAGQAAPGARGDQPHGGVRRPRRAQRAGGKHTPATSCFGRIYPPHLDLAAKQTRRARQQGGAERAARGACSRRRPRRACRRTPSVTCNRGRWQRAATELHSQSRGWSQAVETAGFGPRASSLTVGGNGRFLHLTAQPARRGRLAEARFHAAPGRRAVELSGTRDGKAACELAPVDWWHTGVSYCCRCRCAEPARHRVGEGPTGSRGLCAV